MDGRLDDLLPEASLLLLSASKGGCIPGGDEGILELQPRRTPQKVVEKALKRPRKGLKVVREVQDAEA